ncbi:hypothetical protein FRC09_009527 [Ceratobasidium sp. 395]|nr:hypothetical protein FRC09_009527 [Ceratobasidium sp. 395]
MSLIHSMYKGADFLNVTLILNFLTPKLLEIWLQLSGRGARSGNVTCLCVILITKGIVAKATKLCKDANIEVDPVLLAMKVEESEAKEEIQAKDTPTEPSGSSESLIAN